LTLRNTILQEVPTDIETGKETWGTEQSGF